MVFRPMSKTAAEHSQLFILKMNFMIKQRSKPVYQVICIQCLQTTVKCFVK